MNTDKKIRDLRSAICDLRFYFKFQISNLESFRVLSCLFAAFFFFISGARSQEIPTGQNFHQWGAVTLFSGLPSDNVRAIAQTSDGVLWFGTDNGLARFDGRRVQTVAIENESSAKILALETDAGGKLWIGTEKGLFFQTDGKFQAVKQTENFAVTAILFDKNVFAATANGVILRISEIENSFRVEKIPAESLTGSDGRALQITSLANVGGKIVAGTRSRSVLIVEDGEAFETFSRPRPFFVNALARDANGNAWLGAATNNGESGFFSLRDIAQPKQIAASVGNVSAIEPTDSGEVWVGTEINGLYRFRGESEVAYFTFANTAGGLRSNTINALFLDREGVLWIGTNRGACRYDSSSPFIQTFADDANVNFVRTLFRAADGRIFAGTNRGLFLLADGAWLDTGNFSTRSIYALGEDAQKQLLTGTPNGLFGFDGKQILAGDVRAVVNFQNKTFAAVFGRGLVAVETDAPIFANDSLTALLPDGDFLWIGSAKNGAFFYDGKDVKQTDALNALRGAAIWKIVKDSGANLWFATERGLFLFRDGALQTVTENRDVRGAFASETDVWAATLDGGLLHLKSDENFGWISTDLNVEQGLPSQKIFALLPVENRLLIGTNRGVVAYAPGSIAPKILATRVLSQRLHDAAEISGAINLEYPQNSLLVEVAGLSSRTFPEQFQYAFFLKNAKGEILEKRFSNDSQFAPTDLKAGEYTIEARAFNKDLLASEPLIIKFSVARAPFPLTAASLGVLLFIALIGLTWAIVERRRLAQKNRELAAAKFDLANEAERERKRIARDLHDQTLADLRALMLMSDKIPAETGEFRAEIESVSTEIRRICEDLSPSVLENVGLAPALEFLLSHTFENHKFSAEEHLEERLDFSPNVQMQIYRIAQEVLNNIRRHSDADTVEMRIEISSDGDFILSVADDGAPFNPDEKTPKGRGIANIKSRAALIEAKINWLQNENGGTIFRLWKSTQT
jgi:signal transduction histidine kinase/ligand-binding sensor domain-containing protein